MCFKYEKLQILYTHVKSGPFSKDFTIQFGRRQNEYHNQKEEYKEMIVLQSDSDKLYWVAIHIIHQRSNSK